MIVTSSVAGCDSIAGWALAYSCSKIFVTNLARGLYHEFSFSDKIDVMAYAPG